MGGGWGGEQRRRTRSPRDRWTETCQLQVFGKRSQDFKRIEAALAGQPALAMGRLPTVPMSAMINTQGS